jgi:hypothetical protein
MRFFATLLVVFVLAATAEDKPPLKLHQTETATVRH